MFVVLMKTNPPIEFAIITALSEEGAIPLPLSTIDHIMHSHTTPRSAYVRMWIANTAIPAPNPPYEDEKCSEAEFGLRWLSEGKRRERNRGKRLFCKRK